MSKEEIMIINIYRAGLSNKKAAQLSIERSKGIISGIEDMLNYIEASHPELIKEFREEAAEF